MLEEDEGQATDADHHHAGEEEEANGEDDEATDADHYHAGEEEEVNGEDDWQATNVDLKEVSG